MSIFKELNIPKVICGTSGLGNLFVALEDSVKREIVKECAANTKGKIVFDSAGKYGAGLALESIGKCLRELNIAPENVVISNKLGWYRTELKTPEPTFEPGVWKGLKYDAVQKISYDGILECFEQGNELLNGYIPQMLSVHDPDEYLAKATNKEEEDRLYYDILEAYRALADLKKTHNIFIGVGAKNWKAIEKIYNDVKLDWVMIANSMTIQRHPDDLLEFMKRLEDDGVPIINSAVFHAGFLTGGDYYDYNLVGPETEKGKALFKWREGFFAVCKEFGVDPATACVQFALQVPGVESIALNTTNPKRVKGNFEMAYAELPEDFWDTLKEKGIINNSYNYI